MSVGGEEASTIYYGGPFCCTFVLTLALRFSTNSYSTTTKEGR